MAARSRPSRFPVHHSPFPVYGGDEVDDAHKRQVEAHNRKRERLFNGRDLARLGEFLGNESPEQSLPGSPELVPGVSLVEAQPDAGGFKPQVLVGKRLGFEIGCYSVWNHRLSFQCLCRVFSVPSVVIT
jgi:hypothetical protein